MCAPLDDTQPSSGGQGPQTDESLTSNTQSTQPPALAQASGTTSPATIATRLRSSTQLRQLSIREAMDKQFMDNITKQFESFATKLKGSHNRPKRRELPTFTGEKHHNALAWLELAYKLREFNKIETEAEENEIPDAVLWMGIAMDGAAQTWYATLPHTTKTDFDNFLESFRRAFVRQQPDTLLAEYHKRNQTETETIFEYYLALEQLIKDSTYKLPPEARLHRFIEGLASPFKRYVLEKKPNTIAKALEVATSFEQLNERCPTTSTPTTAVNYIQQQQYPQHPNPLVPLHQYAPQDQPQQQETEYSKKLLAIERQLLQNQNIMNERMLTIQSQLLTMQQQMHYQPKQPSTGNQFSPHNQWRKQFSKQQPRYEQRRKPPNTNYSPPPKKSLRPYCNFCRWYGHWTTDCRKRQTYLDDNMSTVLCSSCHGYGHWNSQCHLPNPSRVPPSMLDTSNSPPPPPTASKTKYNVPVPKQGHYKPQTPPPRPTTDTTAVNFLTEQLLELKQEQAIQNKFLTQLQQQRQNPAVEPTQQQPKFLPQQQTKLFPTQQGTKFFSSPPTDDLYDSGSSDTGF